MYRTGLSSQPCTKRRLGVECLQVSHGEGGGPLFLIDWLWALPVPHHWLLGFGSPNDGFSNILHGLNFIANLAMLPTRSPRRENAVLIGATRVLQHAARVIYAKTILLSPLIILFFFYPVRGT